MKYKIIGDSCMDLTKELKKDPHYQLIPLTLQVDDQHFVDDDSFDQAAFLKAAAASPNCPKSACPSPGAFWEAYQNADADMIFVVTLSQHLSGSYNSAVVAQNMFQQKNTGKKVAVISSDSASCGETLIGMEIQRLAEKGMSFEEIEAGARAFLKEMKTYFVLESLEALRKNGRLTGLQAFFASALNIKPVMGSDSGTIIKLNQARGIKRALERMVEIFAQEVKNPQNKTVAIAHCNCRDRAEYVKQMLEKKMRFAHVCIMDTAGVSTLYASDGGIIVCC